MENLYRIDRELVVNLDEDLIEIGSPPTLQQMQTLADKYNIPPQLVHYINYYIAVIQKYFVLDEPIYAEAVPNDQVYTDQGVPLKQYAPPPLYVHKDDVERISLQNLAKRPFWG